MRATDFVGLGWSAAARYLVTARRALPLAVRALRSSDPERSRLLDDCAPYVHQIVGQGVPKSVQRALVTHGFRLAHGAARDGAPAHGFEPDELEDELRAFQRAFETRLFFGS